MSFLTEIKVIFIFIMIFSAGLAGCLVISCKKLQQSEKFLSFGNCFAAGIFLLVGVVHLLGESQENFVEALGEEIPLGYIVAVGGYSLILMIENVLLGGHDHSMHKEDEAPKINDKAKIPLGGESQAPFNGDFQLGNPDHECDNQDCVVTTPPKKHAEIMPAFVLTCALVIHSVLEGVAAGIITSETNLVILCIAILIHNIPAAFSLGVKLAKLNNLWRFFLMAAFVISSPLGIAIGIGISKLNYPIIQAIFLALSAGTFIYIGCTEILPEQFHEKKNKWLKFTGFLTGFAPLAILSCFIHE